MNHIGRTQKQVLCDAVRTLGGTWDARRAVAVLRDHGHNHLDQRAKEKYARKLLRHMAKSGLITRINDRPVEYRVSEQPQSQKA